jgi:uncharacterized protein
MPQSARFQDQNGYLLIVGCPLASSGVFQYSAAQVGLPGDPNRIVNVYRPPEAVSDDEYIASLQVIPFINDHEMLSGFQGDNSAAAPESYGVDGVLFDVGFDAPWVRGDLKIFSRSMQADLAGGKKDLSLGYTCDFEVKTIVVDGVECEVIQTNMRGNHIALVEVGRVPGARVLDGKRLCFDALSFDAFSINGGFTMPKGRARKALDADLGAQLAAQLKALLPTFEQFLNGAGTDPAAAGQAGAAGAGAQQAETATDPAATAAAPAAPATNPNASEAAPAAQAGETGSGEVAAQTATAAQGGEGEEDTGGADPAAIAQQLIALLQKFVEATGGEQATTPQAGSGEGTGEAASGSGEASSGEGSGESETGDGESESGEGEGEGESTETQDETEGIDPSTEQGVDPSTEGIADESAEEGGQGTAPQGPAAGKHTGADAALRRFYSDAARKTSLVERLSLVVGAFDGALDIARATAADVAAYGVKKLKLKCAKGSEVVALDAYLTGVEASHAAPAIAPASQTTAVDSAEDSAVSAYLKQVTK